MSARSMMSPLATLAFAIAAVLGPAFSSEAFAQVTVSGPADAAETYGCLICHKDKRAAFQLGVHSDRGVRCHDCHGGDPAAFEKQSDLVDVSLRRLGQAREIVDHACHTVPLGSHAGSPAGRCTAIRTTVKARVGAGIALVARLADS